MHHLKVENGFELHSNNYKKSGKPSRIIQPLSTFVDDNFFTKKRNYDKIFLVKGEDKQYITEIYGCVLLIFLVTDISQIMK